MPRLDEHLPAPRLDKAAITRLTDVLDQPGVVSAALIGSQARGDVRPLSDVDLAVWLDPHLDRRERHELALRLADLASQALATPAVDLVVLNDAPPLLRHRARRDGRRLVERDHAARVGLERDALLEFLDTAPLRATLAAGRRRRLREGTYGRRR